MNLPPLLMDGRDNTDRLQLALDAAALRPDRTVELDALGVANFDGPVTVPMGVRRIRHKYPGGDIGGYIPDAESPFPLKLKFNGGGLFIPLHSSLEIEGLELEGNEIGVGVCIANASYVYAALENGSAIVSLSTPSYIGVRVGDIVMGDGVPAGTTVTSIAGNALTLSNTVTSTGPTRLTIIHKDYPSGTNYPTFAGNSLRMVHCYVHDFAANLFVFFGDGYQFGRCNFGNGRGDWKKQIVLHAPADITFRNCWIGGRDDATGVTDGIAIVAEDATDGILFEACEVYQSAQALVSNGADVTFAGCNFEMISAGASNPWFDVTGGVLTLLSSNRLTMGQSSPGCLPIKLRNNANLQVLGPVKLPGASSVLLAEADYLDRMVTTYAPGFYDVRVGGELKKLGYPATGVIT